MKHLKIILSLILFMLLMFNCSVDKNPLSLISLPSSYNKIAFISDRDEGRFCIFIMDKDGSNQINLTYEIPYAEYPLFTPKGTRILFNTANEQNIYEICSMDPDGTNKSYLTNNGRNNGLVEISNDGRKIIYISGKWPSYDIYWMNSDGSNKENLTNNPAQYSSIHLSQNGRKIVFSRRDTKYADIYIMDLDGKTITNVTSSAFDDKEPDISPNGENILFVSNREVYWGLYIMDTSGKNIKKLAGDLYGNNWHQFSPDGQKICYISRVNGKGDIF